MIFDQHLIKDRNRLNQATRNFFNKEDFLEVETPLLTTIPGMEPHLTPFETKLTTPQKETHALYLNTSPELQMKKLLGAGFKKIYNITKVFRDGELGGGRHNPEFTMLEWYRAKANYKDLMTDCENYITSLIGKPTIQYQENEIDLSSPWTRKSVHELFLEHCDIDLLKNKTFTDFAKTAKSHNHNISACQDWDDIFFKIFLNEIEPHLGLKKPIFIYDYPATQAALARKTQNNPFWAERFELYIGGIELANAFSELIDSNEQRLRLQEEQEHRKKLGKTVFDIDEEFLASLESIQNECAGIALGLDRLYMLLLNKRTIEEVLLFPLTKMINTK